MISSSSRMEVDKIGLPNISIIVRTMSLSGTRIPTVFFLLFNNFGTWLFAFRINVNGPGSAFFSIRKVLLSIGRSEEHTSELQSLMRISYAVFCLTKKNKQ